MYIHQVRLDTVRKVSAAQRLHKIKLVFFPLSLSLPHVVVQDGLIGVGMGFCST